MGGGVLVILTYGFSGHFAHECIINIFSTVICGASFGLISTDLIYLSLHVGIFVGFVSCFDIRILEVL